MKLRDHPKLSQQWPPEPGGAGPSSLKSPIGRIDVLEEVLTYPNASQRQYNIALKTRYEGQTFTRDLIVDDLLFAANLTAKFREHIGSSITALDEIDVDLTPAKDDPSIQRERIRMIAQEEAPYAEVVFDSGKAFSWIRFRLDGRDTGKVLGVSGEYHSSIVADWTDNEVREHIKALASGGVKRSA
jgi:hypothetical protein